MMSSVWEGKDAWHCKEKYFLWSTTSVAFLVPGLSHSKCYKGASNCLQTASIYTGDLQCSVAQAKCSSYFFKCS